MTCLGIINPYSLKTARDYSLVIAELITTIQEINLIVINLTEKSEEPFQIPIEVVEILESLYSKTKEFNNYMINLDQCDIEYYTYVDEDEEEQQEDDDG